MFLFLSLLNPLKVQLLAQNALVQQCHPADLQHPVPVGHRSLIHPSDTFGPSLGPSPTWAPMCPIFTTTFPCNSFLTNAAPSFPFRVVPTVVAPTVSPPPPLAFTLAVCGAVPCVCPRFFRFMGAGSSGKNNDPSGEGTLSALPPATNTSISTQFEAMATKFSRKGITMQVTRKRRRRRTKSAGRAMTEAEKRNGEGAEGRDQVKKRENYEKRTSTMDKKEEKKDEVDSHQQGVGVFWRIRMSPE